MAACWVLQPIAAAYAARGLGCRPAGAMAAGVLAACAPVLLARTGHLNLCAHFLLLAALGLIFRRRERRGGWIAPGGVMLLAVLVHPYLFEMTAALFAAVPLQALLTRRATWRSEAVGCASSVVAVAGAFLALNGLTGGKEAGYSFFSMNLLSPIWPQRSGIFGPDLPVLDATGGQYEGFNWLGTGVLLLVFAAAASLIAPRRADAPEPRTPISGLLVVLGALATFSLSSRVYAGHVKLLDLGAQPWDNWFGTFRVSGRAFWPVGYAIMLFAVASVERLPRVVGGLLLVAAVGLQIIDTQPLRNAARAAWTSGDQTPTPPIPVGTTLFTAAPFAGCGDDLTIGEVEPLMILDAVRGGARTGQIGVGRRPAWFSCVGIDSDALELPMAPGEVRAVFGQALQTRLRTEALGPETVCRGVQNAILCGRGVAMPEGTDPPRGASLPRLEPGETLRGAALLPALGFGWKVSDAPAAIWSEGTRSTLVIAAPSQTAFQLSLELEGVAGPVGGRRLVRAMVGRREAAAVAMNDGGDATLNLDVSTSDLPDGILRVALDLTGDMDPRKYGIEAPVQRAAIKLRAIDLRKDPITSLR
jgi:hypothetical protein